MRRIQAQGRKTGEGLETNMRMCVVNGETCPIEIVSSSLLFSVAALLECLCEQLALLDSRQL